MYTDKTNIELLSLVQPSDEHDMEQEFQQDAAAVEEMRLRGFSSVQLFEKFTKENPDLYGKHETPEALTASRSIYG